MIAEGDKLPSGKVSVAGACARVREQPACYCWEPDTLTGPKNSSLSLVWQRDIFYALGLDFAEKILQLVAK